MSTMVLPFVIGQTYWRPLTNSDAVRVPCPVCAGRKTATVIMGDGEHVSVPCDACEAGYEGPRGYITEYQHEPAAEPVVVTNGVSYYDGVWTVEVGVGRQVRFSDLYATEAEALAASAKHQAELHERNMQSRQQSRRGTRRLTWSVQYHRSKIKDLERQIEWHRAKVQEAKS